MLMEQAKSCFTNQSANNECAEQIVHLRILINTFFYYGISRIVFLMVRSSAVCKLFYLVLDLYSLQEADVT